MIAPQPVFRRGRATENYTSCWRGVNGKRKNHGWAALGKRRFHVQYSCMAAISLSDKSVLRPLDVRRDLPEVADLIDLCFANQMDLEGREYIRYIRRVANNPALVRWVPGAAERVSMPLYGYVWVEQDRIIGNLTIIPFTHQGRWIYLIANVAVHPDSRRRGIGRALTLRALEHIRAHHVSEAWLQVRDDNPAAIDLYASLGFLERVRRTTWQSAAIFDANSPTPAGITVTARHPSDWQQQSEWLRSTYPPEVSWNLAFDWRRLRPGIVRALAMVINGETLRHYSARQNDHLVGAFTWEPGRALSDTLWLAADPYCEVEAARALLAHARRIRLSNRFLTVNYPAGRAVEAFADCGFTPLNTLIWMSANTAQSQPG